MQTLSSIYTYSLVDQREEAVWKSRGIKPLIPASVSVRAGTSGGLSKWISRASQLRSPFSVLAGLLFLGGSPVPGQSQLYRALPWSRCPFLENSRVAAAGPWAARKVVMRTTCEPWWKSQERREGKAVEVKKARKNPDLYKKWNELHVVMGWMLG